jgi:gluconate 2-dehydrogenase gamma chain
MSDLTNRRMFLRAAAAASAAWAVADLAQIEDALAWAAQQMSEQRRPEFSVLTPEQAKVVDVVASRILPSVDGNPGAHDAGAVYFIDRSLSTFNANQKTLYADGVADLNRRAAQKWKGTGDFAALTTSQQDALLHDIEHTRFFEAARFDTLVGTFALPSWGGNRNHAGWQLLGMTHEARYEPPFGYYDAEANKGS